MRHNNLVTVFLYKTKWNHHNFEYVTTEEIMIAPYH
jgi:hypothetical protein